MDLLSLLIWGLLEALQALPLSPKPKPPSSTSALHVEWDQAVLLCKVHNLPSILRQF